MVREFVEEALADLLTDPDEGLELRDEFRNELLQSLKSLKEGGVTYDAKDVASRLGLVD